MESPCSCGHFKMRLIYVGRLWVICQEDIYHPQNSDIYHPQIRTFPTPQKKTFARRTTATPNFFSLIFGAFFFAFSTYSSWRTSPNYHRSHQKFPKSWTWDRHILFTGPHQTIVFTVTVPFSSKREGVAVVLLANVFFWGWEMSEFGGGKCPNFGGGKCPPGKWLTIV